MCAGTAALPTQIVCAFAGLPGGMWQIVVFLVLPGSHAWISSSTVIVSSLSRWHAWTAAVQAAFTSESDEPVDIEQPRSARANTDPSAIAFRMETSCFPGGGVDAKGHRK